MPSADLIDSVLRTNLLSEGEFATELESLRNPIETSAAVLSSVDSVTSFSAWAPRVDAGAHTVFAALADSDLPTDELAFLDDVLRTRRTAAIRRLQFASSADAYFASFASKDSLYLEVTNGEKAGPFRRGFVDIGESIEELFSEHLNTKRKQAGDSRDSQENSPANIIAEYADGDTHFVNG